MPALLVLAACGSSAPAAHGPGSEPSNSLPATFWSLQEAGQRYVELIQPVDAHLLAVLGAARVGDPLVIAAACAEALHPLDSLHGALAGGAWPMRAQGPVITVMTMDAALQTDLAACARDGNDKHAMGTVTYQMIRDANTEKAASDFVRADLGLPSG